MHSCASLLAAICVFAMPTYASTYYITPNGSDSNAGTSIRSAWRTLAAANAHRFRAGDRILLEAGSRFAGPLQLTGVAAHPGAGLVVISSFGNGRATIDGRAGDGIVVTDVEGLRIENLALAAAGREANDGLGIALKRSTKVQILQIDVGGFRMGGAELQGCREVLLERVYAHDNGSSGITVLGGYDDVPRCRDVTIRNCRSINNPGDPKNHSNHSGNGIVVGAVDGCLIEYCEAAENGWDMPRTGNGPVGIWAWNASHVVIRHCISHDNKSPGTDGGGFDLDGGVTDSIVEDNLSYGNHGAGYLLCQYENAGPWHGNIVRNNISYNDGSKNFNSGIALYLPEGMTNMGGVIIENNTIVNPNFGVATMGDIPDVLYARNLFITGMDVMHLTWGSGGFHKSRFDANMAWSLSGGHPSIGNPSLFRTSGIWESSGGRLANPEIALPPSGERLVTEPHELSTMPWFVPNRTSPCRKARRVIIGADLKRP